MKFKVGDEVIMILDGNSIGGKQKHKNKVSIIDSIDNGAPDYKYIFNNYGWRSSELELIKKSTQKGETKMSIKKADVSIRGIVADMYGNIKDAQLVDKFFGEELRNIDVLLISNENKKGLLIECKRLQKEEDDKE